MWASKFLFGVIVAIVFHFVVWLVNGWLPNFGRAGAAGDGPHRAEDKQENQLRGNR